MKKLIFLTVLFLSLIEQESKGQVLYGNPSTVGYVGYDGIFATNDLWFTTGNATAGTQMTLYNATGSLDLLTTTAGYQIGGTRPS